MQVLGYKGALYCLLVDCSLYLEYLKVYFIGYHLQKMQMYIQRFETIELYGEWKMHQLQNNETNGRVFATEKYLE